MIEVKLKKLLIFSFILLVLVASGCVSKKEPIRTPTPETTSPPSYATIKTFYVQQNWVFTSECEARKEPTFEVPTFLVIDVDSNIPKTKLSYKVTMSKNGEVLKVDTINPIYPSSSVEDEIHYNWKIQCVFGTGTYDFKLEVLDENSNVLDTEYSTYIIQ